MRDWPDFSEVFAGIRWAVAGGVATRNYMPERATEDLDVLVATDQYAEAMRRLTDAGYVTEGPLSIAGSAWRSPEGIAVDLIDGQSGWCDEALDPSRTQRDQQGLPVLDLPFLILMKLKAGRMRDGADISALLGYASAEERRRIRDVVRRYFPESLEDLDSMIASADLEFGGDATR